MPSVDVLVPHFNDSEGFAVSLRSVEGQDWNGDIRVVVADDGSNGDELASVKALLDASPLQSHVVENGENRGRPYTRNVLLDQMVGDYVAWLDAGDEWLPEKTRRQVSVLESRSADVDTPGIWVTCSYEWRQSGVRTRILEQKVDDDAVRSLLQGQGLRAYLWTILAPRAAMQAVGYFDENLPRLQDLDFFIRFALKRGVFVQPDDPSPLSVYHKVHHGRDHHEIVACHEYIRNKHAVLYERYGRRFLQQTDYSAYRNAERFAVANEDLEAARSFRRRVRLLKWRMRLGL